MSSMIFVTPGKNAQEYLISDLRDYEQSIIKNQEIIIDYKKYKQKQIEEFIAREAKLRIFYEMTKKRRKERDARQ